MYELVDKKTGKSMDIFSKTEQDCWQVRDGIAEWREVVTPIETLRVQTWERIKAKRDAEELLPLPYMGKLLDFDDKSNKRLEWAHSAAVSAITLGGSFETDWTCYDGSTLHMTAQDILGIPIAVAERANVLHVKARSIGQQLLTATTAEEITTIENQW